MVRNVISLLLLIVSVALNFKHAWDSFFYKNNPQSLKMMLEFALPETTFLLFGILAVAGGLLLLFPQTFFWGNVLNALAIVLVMSLALRAGNLAIFFLEIPFLSVPLLLIWLKYPFKN